MSVDVRQCMHNAQSVWHESTVQHRDKLSQCWQQIGEEWKSMSCHSSPFTFDISENILRRRTSLCEGGKPLYVKDVLYCMPCVLCIVKTTPIFRNRNNIQYLTMEPLESLTWLNSWQWKGSFFSLCITSVSLGGYILPIAHSQRLTLDDFWELTAGSLSLPI